MRMMAPPLATPPRVGATVGALWAGAVPLSRVSPIWVVSEPLLHPEQRLRGPVLGVTRRRGRGQLQGSSSGPRTRATPDCNHADGVLVRSVSSSARRAA